MTDRLRGCIELTRPANAVAAAVLTFTGAFVAGIPESGALWPVAAAVAATALATGAGNAINDYFDRDVDAVNRPDRPIPRGAVSARGALAFSGVLFALAVALALTLPLPAIAIAVLNLVALVAYTEFFKGLPGVGNVVVGYLTGSTFLFGGAAVGRPFGAVVLAFLAGVATLTREIAKDVEDVAGDREEGLRTLPIAVGEQRALAVGTVIMVFAVLASALPVLLGPFGLVYLVAVLPADAVMLHATARSFDDPGAGQRELKAGMFAAAAAFILGRVAVVFGFP